MDETLIHLERNISPEINKDDSKAAIINNINLKKLKLIFRPGLFDFLREMKSLYELIIFSSGVNDYVDAIVEIIEKDGKFFDHILYRTHLSFDKKGEYVKNLSSLGRDLNKILIIDDNEKYYKWNKENGICIKPFFGDEVGDQGTLAILSKILKKIRIDAEESKDIRISLNKYKAQLYPKVIATLN